MMRTLLRPAMQRRFIPIERRYHDRRRGPAVCAHGTLPGGACRGIASRRCAACGTITCGVHVERPDRRPACPACGATSVLFRRRGGDRRTLPQ